MVRSIIAAAVLSGLLLITSGCPSRQEGSIKGTVTPAGSEATVTALREGSVQASLSVDQDGTYLLPIPPGTYEVRVASLAAPFPITFPDIVVEPGKTTMIPPVDFAPAAGRSTLSGSVSPKGDDTTISLIYEGRERAAIRPANDGSYAFTELPAGDYALRVSAPGYAEEKRTLTLSGENATRLDARLLYMTEIEGVDWNAGTVRVTGIGMPPKKAENATVRREMAKRAALTDGQRKLLKALGQVNIAPRRKLMAEGNYTERIQGFVKGFRVVGERLLNDGRVEMDLELPLTGNGGLSELISRPTDR